MPAKTDRETKKQKRLNSQTKTGNTPAKTYRQRDKETEKVEQPDKERKHTSKNLQTERQRNRKG